MLAAWGIPKWSWFFKMVLGPYFVRGTWVGYLLTKNGTPRIFIEKYEQTFATIYMRGWSYTLDKKASPVEALGKLQFDRDSESSGPCKMMGYTIDGDADKKLRYIALHKLSDQLIDLDIAKCEAFEKFKDAAKNETGSLKK